MPPLTAQLRSGLCRSARPSRHPLCKHRPRRSHSSRRTGCPHERFPHLRRKSSVCRTPYILPTRLRREPEKPPCPPSDWPGVDLGFVSYFDYLPSTEAVPACTSIVASNPTEPVSRCPLRALPQLSETSLIAISTAVGPWMMGPSGLRLTTRRKVGTTIPSKVTWSKQ